MNEQMNPQVNPQMTNPVNTQMSTEQFHNEDKTKRVVMLVVAVVVIALVAWWYGAHKRPAAAPASNVQATEVNLSQALADKNNPPAWFPAGLPIELANVSEQKSIVYPDKKITLYSITYTSARQMEELYATYGAYFAANKFTIVNHSKTSQMMSYQATKGADTVSVVITPQSTGATVQIGIQYQQ